MQTFAQRNIGFLKFFSCIVLDLLLNLQPKTDTNKQIKAKFNKNETNIKVKI